MSDQVNHPSQTPESEGAEHTSAPNRPVQRSQTRTVMYVAIGMLGLFLILLAIGVIPRIRNHQELAAAAQKAQNNVPGVYVVRPQAASDADLTLAATTQAIQDSIIYARTSGYVRKRYVDIGDQVTAGQLLAEIESPEIYQQLQQAQADLQQSEKNLDVQKANLDLARTTMARYEAADAEGAVAKQLLDQNVSAHRSAQATVAAAQANVQSNKANVQRLQDLTSFQRVLAPFNGTVIQRNIDVGALITAGSPTNNTAAAPTSVTGGANGLFEVAQIDALRVFVNVPQAYAPNVKAGLPVQVTVRGRLMQPVTAKVTRTANAIDPGTRTLLTQVDIPNQMHGLLPGMFVYVGFKIEVSGTHWRVPATAVIFDAQGTRVAIVGPGNKLHFQKVTLGRDFGTSIDIQAGLNGNEMIVKQPTVSLQEGQLVNPIESKNPSGS
ncbi:MAG: efflux RND transporter periplasmic adaptor subunit [Deltaproteobacteria bacterium]|nr:MAG: efflux RND transporter periplasmic adaptor subunit [Deltaproteobacteria bacterium]